MFGRLRSIASSRSPLRLFSSEADQGFIILNPRQAGIVRRPRRRAPHRLDRERERERERERIGAGPATGAGTGAGVLQPPPLEPQLPPQLSVVSEIHSRRPESGAIPAPRYTQLRDELRRGFKKSQLAEYLAAQGLPLAKSATKQALVTHILNTVWNCHIGHSPEGALIENSIELNERDFVLLLGGQGRLLREWSKSGARISLLPRRCQIQVHSRQQTFDWINASLSRFLESVIATDVDIAEFKKLLNPLADPARVAAIQQLTDTYFGNKNLDADVITVYSAGHNKLTNAALVKRLLLHLADPITAQKWRPSSWVYDANAANHASYFLHPYEDTDSFEWTARLQNWSRWEAVKRKNLDAAAVTNGLHTPDLRTLQSPEFNAAPIGEDVSPAMSSFEDQVKRITADLCAAHPAPTAPDGTQMNTTLTFTPGYVLHDAGNEAVLPNAAMPKSFNSNIPHVAALASTLPMYAKDVHHDDSPAVQDSPQRDLWMDILNMEPGQKAANPLSAEPEKRVFTARRKDLPLAPNMRLIQMKFVADPTESHTLDYPPVVAWAMVPKPSSSGVSSRLEEVPRVDAVPLEASAHVSMPGEKSDLKVSLAHTYPIKITKDVETYFMKKCNFGRLGPQRIPPELQFEIGGTLVPYLYHSSVYITLAELELNKQLLHLSQVEGGRLGGRRIEASLVLHAESPAELSATEVAETAHVAVEFIKKL